MDVENIADRVFFVFFFFFFFISRPEKASGRSNTGEDCEIGHATQGFGGGVGRGGVRGEAGGGGGGWGVGAGASNWVKPRVEKFYKEKEKKQKKTRKNFYFFVGLRRSNIHQTKRRWSPLIGARLEKKLKGYVGFRPRWP